VARGIDLKYLPALASDPEPTVRQIVATRAQEGLLHQLAHDPDIRVRFTSIERLPYPMLAALENDEEKIIRDLVARRLAEEKQTGHPEGEDHGIGT
jgi:hypothetical protein